MDPNETLRLIRKTLPNVNMDRWEGADEAAVRLTELVQALDEWLSKGGALPADWNKGR